MRAASATAEGDPEQRRHSSFRRSERVHGSPGCALRASHPGGRSANRATDEFRSSTWAMCATTQAPGAFGSLTPSPMAQSFVRFVDDEEGWQVARQDGVLREQCSICASDCLTPRYEVAVDRHRLISGGQVDRGRGSIFPMSHRLDQAGLDSPQHPHTNKTRRSLPVWRCKID